MALTFSDDPNWVVEAHTDTFSVPKEAQEASSTELGLRFVQNSIPEGSPGTKHFVGTSASGDPVAVSVYKATSGDAPHAVAIRHPQGCTTLTLTPQETKLPVWRRIFGLGPTCAALVEACDPSMKLSNLKRVKEVAKFSKAAAKMDADDITHTFKFGILRLCPGQETEDILEDGETLGEEKMFGNKHEDDSPTYREFLEDVGEIVELKGWSRFRGGLDAVKGYTGEHSLFAEHDGEEIMFHVATMLPWSNHDVQQLERKRHLGNDLSIVVFWDPPAGGNDEAPALEYHPAFVASKQIHNLILVSKDVESGGYKVAVASQKSVPAFGPPVPKVVAKADFRRWILDKLTRSERATYRSPGFAARIARTRGLLLRELQEHI